MIPIPIPIPVASDSILILIPVFPKKTLIPILIPGPASRDPDSNSNKPGFDSNSDFGIIYNSDWKHTYTVCYWAFEFVENKN